ncbi:MAG: glycosyltransferase [Verrucomicrobiae bacterium]|nr:glycosyltransferase [Verrucomicrobiae bacterium]
MKVLFFSNLYPDRTEPGRGLPNARLIRRLQSVCEVRVISPRPIWPFLTRPHRRALPEDDAVQPIYPPAWYLPKVGSRWNAWLMQCRVRPYVQQLHQRWPFDLVLAAWLYPDACAVQPLAEALGVPLIPIAQGSDVHQYLQHPVRRRLMQRHLEACPFLIARSRHLAKTLEEAGFNAARLRVIYNGVDAQVFHPGDSQQVRQRLALRRDARILLWVGNFLPVKNPLMAVEAARIVYRRLGEPFYLVMVGDGPLGPTLAERARHWRVPLILAGRRSEADTAEFMRAADGLCLTSYAEGTPNVLLEALSCGLPVVATAVGGVPEIIQTPNAGRLVPSGDAAALAEALLDLWAAARPREAVAETVREFTWEKTVQRYMSVMQEALASGTRP